MRHHFCVTTNHKCNATPQMNFPLSEEVFIPCDKHVNTTNRMPFLLVLAAFYSTNYPPDPFVTLTHPLQAAHIQWLILTDSHISTANSACSSPFPRPQKLSLLYKADLIT